jgi:hypothetical protein
MNVLYGFVVAVSVVVAVYTPFVSDGDGFAGTLVCKKMVDVEPDVSVAPVVAIVDVAVDEANVQHEFEPLVSDAPVLHAEPLSRNFDARSAVVLADTVKPNSEA